MQDPEAAPSVADIAAAHNLSHNQLIRRFRKVHNCTPKKFIVQARLRRASDLLLNSTATVAEIAEMLGYSDAFAFSHQFTKHYRKSPLQWRLGKRPMI